MAQAQLDELRAGSGSQASQRMAYEPTGLGIRVAVEACAQVGRGPARRLMVQLVVQVSLDQTAEAVVAPGRHRPGNPPRTVGIPRNCTDTGRVPSPVEETQVAADDRRRDAFAQHVLPEVDVLLRVALSITRRTVDAEDLVQDTLLRAFRSMDRFDGAHPRAWLLTIMRNAEVNRNRRRRPELLRDPDVSLANLAAVPSSGAGDPETVVVGETFDAVVAEAYDRLPERHREVVRLVDLDGLSYAEAADVLGVPVGTVMSRLHRARARMRDRLAAAGLAPNRRGG